LLKIIYLLLFCSAIFASDETTTPQQPRNNIETSPLQDLVGALNVDYERKFFDKWTFGAGYLKWDLAFADWEFYYRQYRIKADYWVNGALEQSFYLGGRINYFTIDGKGNISIPMLEVDSDFDGGISGTQFVIAGGYTWMWESFNLSLEIDGSYIGAGKYFVSKSTFLIGADFKIGYRF
jgi:hypothetical protein